VIDFSILSISGVKKGQSGPMCLLKTNRYKRVIFVKEKINIEGGRYKKMFECFVKI
jgi:hypothetical protein